MYSNNTIQGFFLIWIIGRFFERSRKLAQSTIKNVEFGDCHI